MHLGSEILPKLLLGQPKDTSRLAYIVVGVLLYLFLVCHSLASTAQQSFGVTLMACNPNWQGLAEMWCPIPRKVLYPPVLVPTTGSCQKRRWPIGSHLLPAGSVGELTVGSSPSPWVYHEEKHIPHLLPCLHTLCLGLLAEIGAKCCPQFQLFESKPRQPCWSYYKWYAAH